MLFCAAIIELLDRTVPSTFSQISKGFRDILTHCPIKDEAMLSFKRGNVELFSRLRPNTVGGGGEER